MCADARRNFLNSMILIAYASSINTWMGWELLTQHQREGILCVSVWLVREEPIGLLANGQCSRNILCAFAIVSGSIRMRWMGGN